MQKKILTAILAAPLLLGSCLGSTEYEYSPEAAITAFSLGNIKYWYNDINTDGNDTIVSSTIAGSAYKFTIDQKENRIYNVDSLPQGTVTDKMLVTISYSGSLYYRKYHTDGQYVDTLYSSSDSIDFTEPLTFWAISTDGTFVRKYEATVNVHTVNPDSVCWSKTDANVFKGVTKTTAVLNDDDIIVFGIKGGSAGMLSSNDSNGQWTAFTKLEGIEADAIENGISYIEGIFYAVSGNKLYKSADGLDWSESDTDTELARLIPFNQTGSYGTMWAVSTDGNIVSSENMSEWNIAQQLPADFPTQSITGISYPLKSNTSIIRSVIVGLSQGSESASVWTKLSTEGTWTRIETPDNRNLRCPALENLQVLRYDGEMYAIGGKGSYDGEERTAYDAFWQSTDNGLTWRDCAAFYDEYSSWNYKMYSPEDLQGASANSFCATLDSHGRIWLITDCGIWKGGINRLCN